MKRNRTIRLGMVGITEGNGHPYSWSAIFNGDGRERMTRFHPIARPTSRGQRLHGEMRG